MPSKLFTFVEFLCELGFRREALRTGVVQFSKFIVFISYIFSYIFFLLGICWVFPLLLLWLHVGFFLFVLFCAVLQTYGVCLLVLGGASSDNDESDRSSSSGVWFVPIPSCE